MWFNMIAHGDSEQIVSVIAEMFPGDIEPISDTVYKDMEYLFQTKQAQKLRQADYAMVQTTAKIEWKPPFNTMNIDNQYMQNTLLPSTAAGMRLTDMHKYADRIRSGDKFPPPILVKQGAILIQADGARRIVAHKLAGLNKIDIIVVLERIQISDILDLKFKNAIKQIHTNHKWFDAYQDIVELGLQGKRSATHRFPNIIDLSCCRDKVVVDFGCNVGHALFEAYFNGASRCVGFEYIQDNVDIINQLATQLQIPVRAYCIDFNTENFDKDILNIIPRWDYSLFLSVYRTLELKDRNGLLQFIWTNTQQGMFFEGHSETIDTQAFYTEVFSQLVNANISFLGTTSDLGTVARLNYFLRKIK